MSSDRQVGMGLGEIPFSAIDRYASRYGVAGVDDFDAFSRIIRAMDAAYRKLSSGPEKGQTYTVPASDAAGIGSLLDRLGARAKAAARPRTKSQSED